MKGVEVDLADSIEADDGGDTSALLVGLEAAPADLHDSFLAGLPHLSEARIAHAKMTDVGGAEAEAHFDSILSLQPTQAMLADFGGSMQGSSLVLPFGSPNERVRVEGAELEGCCAIRLSAEGDDGTQFSRVFALPPGCELSQAGWRGGDLVLLLRDC